MKYLALIAVALLAISGCSKKPASPVDGQPTSGESAPGAPLPPPPKYVAANAQNAPAENVTGEVNAFLTEQLRNFIREKRRMPQSFAELAHVRLDTVPRAPEGKKWVIDTATKEVKAVQAQ